MATITYRKTKTGQWVAYGPAAALIPGQPVRVTKKDGTTKVEIIESVGKPFDVNGTRMAYGYLAAQPAITRTSGLCDECHQAPGTIPATDMSGIPGKVCAPCKRTGYLSFA